MSSRNCETDTESFSILRSYFDKMFTNLEERLDESKKSGTSESKKIKVIDRTEKFKHKSNKIQYQFNLEQEEILYEVKQLLKDGAISRPRKKIQEVIVN